MGDLEKTNFELQRQIDVKDWDLQELRTEIQQKDSEVASLQEQVSAFT